MWRCVDYCIEISLYIPGKRGGDSARPWENLKKSETLNEKNNKCEFSIKLGFSLGTKILMVTSLLSEFLLKFSIFITI